MKRIFLLCAFMAVAVVCAAQNSLINWSYEVKNLSDSTATIVFTGKLADGYHTYSLGAGNSRTEIISVKTKDCSAKGELAESGDFKMEHETLSCYNQLILTRELRLSGSKPVYSGTIACIVCSGNLCCPVSWPFEVKIQTPTKSIKSRISSIFGK